MVSQKFPSLISIVWLRNIARWTCHSPTLAQLRRLIQKTNHKGTNSWLVLPELQLMHALSLSREGGPGHSTSPLCFCHPIQTQTALLPFLSTIKIVYFAWEGCDCLHQIPWLSCLLPYQKTRTSNCPESRRTVPSLHAKNPLQFGTFMTFACNADCVRLTKSAPFGHQPCGMPCWGPKLIINDNTVGSLMWGHQMKSLQHWCRFLVVAPQWPPVYDTLWALGHLRC